MTTADKTEKYLQVALEILKEVRPEAAIEALLDYYEIRQCLRHLADLRAKPGLSQDIFVGAWESRLVSGLANALWSASEKAELEKTGNGREATKIADAAERKFATEVAKIRKEKNKERLDKAIAEFPMSSPAL